MNNPRQNPARQFAQILCLLLVVLILPAGCSRRWFRDQCDQEVKSVLGEKNDPAWDLADHGVYPDARARFSDDSDPDHPPMPPDDPAAKDLSPNPQKPKNGIARVGGDGWLAMLEEFDRCNRAKEAAREAQRKSAESPKQNKSEAKPQPQLPAPREKKDAPEIEQMQYTETASKPKEPRSDGAALTVSPEEARLLAEKEARNELAGVTNFNAPATDQEIADAQSKERTFLLDLPQALQLGLVNSREYQSRREALYLAALPVTVERFAFMPQFFAAQANFFEFFGSQTPEGTTTRLRSETGMGMSKLFSTGALLLLSFANRTVFNFTSAPDTSVSTISLDLIQPLLLGAGKAIVLESLTQAERNLLYVLRDFAKFRQDFYIFLAAGQPNIAGLQFGSGGVNSTTVGVPDRFIPVPQLVSTSTVPALANPQVLPGAGGRLAPSGVGVAPSQGYLSTLVDKAQLVNQYRNIDALRRYLSLFRVYLEGSIVNSVQVGQIEQQLLRSIESGLSQQANYRSSIDQFKQQLGLPMDVRIDLDDAPLQPLFDQTRRFEDISAQFDTIATEAASYGRLEANEIRSRLRKLLTESAFVRGTGFAERFDRELKVWEAVPTAKEGEKVDPLDVRLEEVVKKRDALREKREEMREKEKGDLSPEDARRLEELEFQAELGRFERAIRTFSKKLWVTDKDPFRRAVLQSVQFNVIYRQLLSLLEEAFRDRKERVRQRWPELPRACVEGVDVLRDPDDKVLEVITRTALENRLDLMNRRAQLVDSWRKIKVAANALLAPLNVQYHYDSTTPSGRYLPFSFGGGRDRHQLIIDGSLPLVRIEQRNDYRATLITYQQQRRQLQFAEDQVVFEARSALRSLRAAAFSYHNVQKRQVELAYIQVDQALQAFSQPQAPSGPSLPPGSVGPPGGGAGALTQQLLQNQNSLLQAQNALYNNWIAYLTARMSLYRDLGLMPLDPGGMWTDDNATCGCPRSNTAPERTGDRSGSKGRTDATVSDPK
jgi:hypothetical protein